MYSHALKLGVGEKILIGLTTAVLFFAGFFVSLLALAVGGAMALVSLIKLRRTRRRNGKSWLEGEYHVVRE